MSNDPSQNPSEPQGPPTPPPASPTPPAPQPLPYGSGSEQPEMNPDARMMGMLCHLSSLTGYISGIGFVVGPLIVWLIKKDSMPFVDDQGKESLNFQITILILTVVSAALACVMIGFFLLPIVALIHLIFVIIAGVNASQGKYYRYPVCLRLIK